MSNLLKFPFKSKISFLFQETRIASPLPRWWRRERPCPSQRGATSWCGRWRYSSRIPPWRTPSSQIRYLFYVKFANYVLSVCDIWDIVNQKKLLSHTLLFYGVNRKITFPKSFVIHSSWNAGKKGFNDEWRKVGEPLTSLIYCFFDEFRQISDAFPNDSELR